jgi:hypothetical protein
VGGEVAAGAEGARRLLLACLVAPEPAALLALAAPAAWGPFLALAGEHLAGEPAAQALLGLPEGALPAPVRDRLRGLSAAAAARNGLLLDDLLRAQAVLRAAGVPSAALKGAGLLAAGHYPSIAARHLSDVDLLVRPRDLARAARALAEAGLAPAPSALPPLDGREDALARNPASAHLPPLAGWSGGLLELHDRLPGGGPPADEVVGAARRVEWRGAEVEVAALGDLAGTLCRHVLRAHGDDPRLRARHAADLAALEAARPDWPAIGARYGARPVARSLELLAAARREAAGEGRAPGRLGLLERAGPGFRARARWASLLPAAGGPAAGALLRAAFPSRRYMEARYGLAPGAPLPALLLRYPRRLLAGALRRLVGR